MAETVRHDLMRTTNMLSVFDCIRKHGPVSKRMIQEETGLSWGAVSSFSSVLLERGVISEAGRVDAGAGRSAIAFDIDLENNLILGIDANVIGMTGVVIDLKSRVKTTIHQELCSHRIEELLEQMKRIIRELISGVQNPAAIKGIGVAFPGHVDSQRGYSMMARQFSSLEPLDVCGILRREFHLPVVIEHDPNCSALSEQLFGAGQGVDNLLYVRLSKGIGMGIILDGSIYHGCSGATGEIGHITMDPDGEECYCGNHGCLEIYASSDAILKRCARAVRMGDAPHLAQLLADGRPLTLETGKPMLGICRGIQLFNVMLGGSLYQDIPTECPSDVEHHETPPYDKVAHPVTVEQGTPLYQAVGVTQMGVNSYHHQGIKELGKGLRVAAKAPDGMVEAVYLPDHPFALAVQWHPEFSRLSDENSRRIFEAFVKAARK